MWNFVEIVIYLDKNQIEHVVLQRYEHSPVEAMETIQRTVSENNKLIKTFLSPTPVAPKTKYSFNDNDQASVAASPAAI